MLRAILCAFLLLPPPSAAQDPGDWCALWSCHGPDEDDLDDQWDSVMSINPYSELTFCEDIYWRAIELWAMEAIWKGVLPNDTIGVFAEGQDPPVVTDYSLYLFNERHRDRVIAHEACESLGLGDELCDHHDDECLLHGGHLAQLLPPTLPRIERSPRVLQQVTQTTQVSEADTLSVVTMSLRALTSGWEEDQVVVRTMERVDHLLRRTEEEMRSLRSDCEKATDCIEGGKVWVELAGVTFKPDSAYVHVGKVARGTSNKPVQQLIKVTLTPSKELEGWIIQNIEVLAVGH